ncbi:MAG: uroporphyrinogen decarboxylase [Planctomycetes bacterium]|nr:uroporphyrinogen decarboxylase [Planctomycetota bacterium]
MAVLRNDLLLRAARRERTERTPVWMMRQAGRADPEYRALRERSSLPLESLFRSPDLATQISLLPKRFGVDAIIFFQDILTPLAPMGAEFIFRPGPILDTPIRTASDVDGLKGFDPSESLGFVGEILTKVRRELDGELPLLGFAGAPLTLASFLLEGESPSASLTRLRSLMVEEPAACHRLLELLANTTIAYLRYQIDEGAHAVQLFESVADLLTPEEYEMFAHPYQVKVFGELDRAVPTLLFAKEQPRVDLMVECGASVLSLGSSINLHDARRRYGHRVAFQGNVDNRLVASGTADEIDAAVFECVQAGGQEGHILNLNHGLLKETPFANVVRVVEATKRASMRLQPTSFAKV